jgi:hypothetical protein
MFTRESEGGNTRGYHFVMPKMAHFIPLRGSLCYIWGHALILCPHAVGSVNLNAIARIGEIKNAYKILVGKPLGRRTPGRPRRKWEDNIRMVRRK